MKKVIDGGAQRTVLCRFRVVPRVSDFEDFGPGGSFWFRLRRPGDGSPCYEAASQVPKLLSLVYFMGVLSLTHFPRAKPSQRSRGGRRAVKVERQG